MRPFKSLFCLLFAAGCLVGCIDTETMKMSIQFQDGDAPAVVTTEYINISSNETEPAKMDEDFDDLIQIWKGDKYRADQAERGLYITSRELLIQDNKLVGRVVGLMNKDKVEEFVNLQVNNKERILLLEGFAAPELVGTNGQVIKTDHNILIVWPEDAKELYWEIRSTDLSEAFSKNREFMVKTFENYLVNREMNEELAEPHTVSVMSDNG